MIIFNDDDRYIYIYIYGEDFLAAVVLLLFALLAEWEGV